MVTIESEGHKVNLNYDSKTFKVSLTDQNLTDKKFSDVWGPKLTRISLTAKKKAKKGTYKYSFTAE